MPGTEGSFVVVGFDGSAPARAALDWAVAEAVHRELPLRVVHTAEHPLSLLKPEPLAPGTQPLLEAQAVIGNAVDYAQQLAPGLTVDRVLGQDHPAQVLIGLSTHAQVIVLGARGVGGFAGLLLGSVSHEVAAHAQCPVVVLRADPESVAEGGVVVGVDPAGQFDPALEAAFDYAQSHSADLGALYAWVPYYLDAPFIPAPVLGGWEADLDAGRSALHEALVPWRERYPNVAVTERFVVAPAAEALVQAAAGARLLVVGSRGRDEAMSLALGSVSHAVLHRATCPVMVVRGRR